MCKHKNAAGIVKTCTSACKNFATCEDRKAALDDSLLYEEQVACPLQRFQEMLTMSKPQLVHSV